MQNFYNNRKAALTHLSDYHQKIDVDQNTIEGNRIEESLEITLEINGDFDLIEVEKEINYLNLLSDLSNEKDIFKEFFRYLNKETAKECLMTMSQDKHFSDAQCENLLNIDTILQIKLTKSS